MKLGMSVDDLLALSDVGELLKLDDDELEKAFRKHLEALDELRSGTKHPVCNDGARRDEVGMVSRLRRTHQPHPE